MKLISSIISKLSVILFFLIGIWATFFYFAMTHEIMDETDDELKSYRNVFISRALINPDLLKEEESLFYRSKVTPISETEARGYKDKWEDMVEYWPIEDEHIPMRVYKSVFLAADKQYYELELRVSTLERDDLLQALFIYIIILYALLLVSIFISIYIILQKSLKPLNKLLVWFQKVTTGKPIPPLENETNITEFRALGEAALAMSERNAQVYEDQKQFIENASHELQTPLAVALNKIELLAEKEGVTEHFLSEIDDIYNTLANAVKLNKSLLLLTRISNGQYFDTVEINVNSLVKDVVNDFQDIIDYKNIRLLIEEDSPCDIYINGSLVRILVTNLLKNAVIHNKMGGEIVISINKNSLMVRNSGSTALNPEKIFQRFYRAGDEKDSTGLGLAIVRMISDTYNYNVGYVFENGQHVFSVSFNRS